MVWLDILPIEAVTAMQTLQMGQVTALLMYGEEIAYVHVFDTCIRHMRIPDTKSVPVDEVYIACMRTNTQVWAYVQQLL